MELRVSTVFFIFTVISTQVFAHNLKNKVIDLYTKRQSDVGARYDPTWESLDARPLPGWYDDAKFGIFIHWGIFSVPAFGNEWFWSEWEGKDPRFVDYINANYPPGFTYQEFAPEFKAEFFDANEWSDIFHASGAKYVVLTSKHHEGYTLWPSSRSFSWNAKEVGPHRDLVEELSKAIREKDDMRFGLYYSLFEWFNPMYVEDRQSSYVNDTYVQEKMLPEMYELINTYKPEILWTDGDWEAGHEYWKSTEFLAWLYNESPVKDTVVSNDRWGSDVPCNHGGFYTCVDRYNPGVLQEHKWENCITVDWQSWGFRRNAMIGDFMSLLQIITELVTTVSCGGNLLMNVGPTKDGTISPIYQERLYGMGKWLDINGEAIFKTTPWIYQNDTVNSNVWYTASKEANSGTVYAITLQWPENNSLFLGALSNRLNKRKSSIYLIDVEDIELEWTDNGNGILISFPNMAKVKSKEAWAIKITDVDSTKKE